MTLRKGLPAKLALTDASDTRYDFKNLVVCNADGSPRGGVTSPVGSSLVTATSTMNVSVAAFAGIAVRDGGVILLANDGATNVLLAAAPGANSRIDVITARQNDASSTVTVPDANNNAAFVVVQGTAAASPVKPAVPAGSLELATVQVPSTATATNSAGVVITQTAVYTAGPGGSVPFRTLADLKLWTTAGPNQTANVFADSTSAANGDYVWPGSAWLASALNISGSVKRSQSSQGHVGGQWSTQNSSVWWVVDQPAVGLSAFNGVWTIPVDGVYQVEFGSKMSASIVLLLAVQKNSTAAGSGILFSGAFQGVAGLTSGTISKKVRLSAGDYLCPAVYLSATAPWDVSAPESSFFAVKWVEPLR